MARVDRQQYSLSRFAGKARRFRNQSTRSSLSHGLAMASAQEQSLSGAATLSWTGPLQLASTKVGTIQLFRVD
jgi:hypothetical protein